MKVHYINILLFAVPLNILAHNNNNNPSITQKIPTTRRLCECELYAPANYDNDQEMKKVMENFIKQTQQRFYEYDDRMKTIRQKCKEKCDKEIQKIILKDKLEKQIEEQLTTLETKINTDDIPTCICEKSLADKVEKGCLRCGEILGSAMPELGAMGGMALYTLSQLKPYALFTAAKYAMFKGAAVGKIIGDTLGKKAVISGLQHFEVDVFFPKIYNSIGNAIPYYDAKTIGAAIAKEHAQNCAMGATNLGNKCHAFEFILEIRDASTLRETGPPASDYIPEFIKSFIGEIKRNADARTAEVSSATYSDIMTEQTALIEAGFNNSITSIYAAIIAIVIIILIMVIIYLILRYRRKKKMKKKLQYIKLLEE
ncbi:rifin PIR protein, putative [Plasmodium reichenowi]|uniref:Rifin PIR protein, putative n=1 Tax=Plasmodium reichenowi TaxID=5854 RepID=A0A2P9DTL8_PLARE|nr:rifin PIR protein, putative [Plasmodium reichenowi]